MTVYILGHEDQTVVTGADGSFSFASVPSGDVKLVLDGRTATNAPAGYLLPRDGDGPDHPAGPGQHRDGEHDHARRARASIPTDKGVYLPRVATSILQTVSNTQPTTLTVQPIAAAGPDAPAAAGAHR